MSRKVKVSLNADNDMLSRARKMKIDLDELFEHALRRCGCEDPAVSEARAKAWREENREAIQAANRHIERHGLWYQGMVREKLIAEGYRKVRKPHVR